MNSLRTRCKWSSSDFDGLPPGRILRFAGAFLRPSARGDVPTSRRAEVGIASVTDIRSRARAREVHE